METNKIKSFAKEARLLLIDGVLQRLKYWGFEENGTNNQDLQTTQGGFVFRGEIYTDTSVPAKWETLKKRLTNKQAVQDVIEQAAYTWFNRLIAVKILEENGYIKPTLAFTEGMRTPQIVQNAKKGIHQLAKQADKDLLLEYLREDKEEQAFGLLITDLCNRNQLLHDIFGRIDDFTEILLPQNVLQKDGVLDLINSNAISIDDYKEVELIGWLYQFYISDKKDEVFAGFKKNKKARAEDIPAATQIFTPKWIVKYMVENTVGKIYLDYEPTSSLKEDMKYLVQNDSDKENKAIISDITELTLIDPASGSGHILVTGFELLFKMYREAGYTAKQAVDNILEHNLFGLDIDDRAMQLARFAVLLKAAQYYPEVLIPNPSVPIPKIYSFPEASHFTSEELQNFLGHDGHQFTAELKEALQLLNQGKNIGSALKLDLSKEAQQHIKKKYADWLQKSKRAGLDIEQSSIWNRLHPFLDVLLVLTKKYASVVANPPYMGQKSMNGELKDYVNTHYPVTKSDLMTIFMEVIPNLTADDSRFALINLPSWLFLSSFEKIRQDYIDNFTFDSLLHMGRGIFGIDFGSVAFAIKKTTNKDAIGSYFRLHERNFQHIYFEDIEKLFLYSNNNEAYKYDFAQYRGDEGITEIPKQGTTKGLKLFYPNIPQTNFSKIPGSPIAYWISDKMLRILTGSQFNQYFAPATGMQTGDNKRFVRQWSEVSIKDLSKKWYPFVNGGDRRKWYGNLTDLILWENDGYEIKNHPSSVLRNKQYYFNEGGTWNRIASKGFSSRYFYTGFIFDQAGDSFFSKDENSIEYGLALLNSKIIIKAIEILCPTLNVTAGNVSLFPTNEKLFDNTNILLLSKDSIAKSKVDWDSVESSWEFEKSPLINDEKSLSQAYQNWQEQVSDVFFQLHANEEELNRIFIDIYGLQDELTPEVALKDITILQEELDREELGIREQGLGDLSLIPRPLSLELPIKKDVVISQFISYLIGVMMGRYRLDKSGLNIAHPNPTEEETSEYLVIRDKGLGSDAQQAIFKYICHEYKEFSRSTGLAKIHGSSNRDLSNNQPVSEGGVVWSEQSVETSSGIHSEQHSRGASERNQGISALSEDSQGLTGGGRNTIGDSLQSEDDTQGTNLKHLSANNRASQNDQRIDEKTNPQSLIPDHFIKQQAEKLIANPKSLIPIKIDEDGILPLMGEGCAFPDDVLLRTRELIYAIWGEDSLTENINFIHDALGMNLHKWLTEKFWKFHTDMYKKKPIYWLFSSSAKSPQKAAFKVLVYMHRMDKYTVQKIQRNYLHPHQEYIKQNIESLVQNEEDLNKQEIKQLEKLRNWELECRDYNEVLKQLAVQEIEIDLDDGVSVNYEKFEGALAVIK